MVIETKICGECGAIFGCNDRAVTLCANCTVKAEPGLLTQPGVFYDQAQNELLVTQPDA